MNWHPTAASINPSMARAVVLPLAMSVWLVGCAHFDSTTTSQGTAVNNGATASKAPPPKADRDAILAMAGEFDVTFEFNETVALEPGYQATQPKTDQAKEVVIVIEDNPGHVVLQHLLLVGGNQVIKHWRQDWTWEASHRFEFSDEQTWEYVALSADQTQGQWTQCVYGVVDTPRYCGTGRWNHRYGNPTWTSDRSWRPLPRRDYSIRDDYNALNVENRHTVTPSGWTHEQDNTKVVRHGPQSNTPLVREFGFNHYQATDEFDFTPAYGYWERTETFWAKVRDQWQDHLDKGRVVVNTGTDGEPIIGELFELAQAVEGEQTDWTIKSKALDGIFERYVDTPQQQQVAQTTTP